MSAHEITSNAARGPIRTLLSASVVPPIVQLLAFSKWTGPAPTLLPANVLAAVELPETSITGKVGDVDRIGAESTAAARSACACSSGRGCAAATPCVEPFKRRWTGLLPSNDGVLDRDRAGRARGGHVDPRSGRVGAAAEVVDVDVLQRQVARGAARGDDAVPVAVQPDARAGRADRSNDWPVPRTTSLSQVHRLRVRRRIHDVDRDGRAVELERRVHVRRARPDRVLPGRDVEVVHEALEDVVLGVGPVLLEDSRVVEEELDSGGVGALAVRPARW